MIITTGTRRALRRTSVIARSSFLRPRFARSSRRFCRASPCLSRPSQRRRSGRPKVNFRGHARALPRDVNDRRFPRTLRFPLIRSRITAFTITPHITAVLQPTGFKIPSRRPMSRILAREGSVSRYSAALLYPAATRSTTRDQTFLPERPNGAYLTVTSRGQA